MRDIPDKIQEAAYKHQIDVWQTVGDKELLAHSTGTGKTLSAIGLCFQRAESAVIVCPLSVLRKWVDEIEHWSDSFELKEKHDRYRVVEANGVEFFIVTKEWFRDNNKKVPGLEAIVIDEAHHFSGTTSSMSKSALNFVKRHNVKYRWLLTATPYRSTPQNIRRLAMILGHSWDYNKFREKYFEPQWIGRRKIMKPRDDIEEEMAELVEHIGHVVKLEDTTDVPDQIHTVERIEINAEQKGAKDRVLKENLDHIVKYTKVHQVENSILVGDEYNENETFKDNKIERINEYLDSSDKVAIICRYLLQLQHLKNNINTDKPVFTIHGGDKNREDTIQAIQQVDEAVVIISAGVSEGYELPNVNTMIFASMGFGLVEKKQMEGRILRKSNMTKNLYVYLLSVYDDDDEESIDEAVYDAVVNRKEKFDLAIYNRDE